jgi:hypothetical protein
MASAASMESPKSNPLHELLEAVADRRGELDIRLEHLSLKLPMIPESVELNGTITVSVHMRELTDREKEARVAKELRALGR